MTVGFPRELSHREAKAQKELMKRRETKLHCPGNIPPTKK
jgi:hypothetical protein